MRIAQVPICVAWWFGGLTRLSLRESVSGSFDIYLKNLKTRAYEKDDDAFNATALFC
jgi:hypothetical protein